ncbi:MAG: histidine--tRNA ligase, partial [Elusimicrobia bacterium]|nr:histidine--tRNA ligase [Elusimicrobiota bacterium]
GGGDNLMKYQPPRGTRDIFGDDVCRFGRIVSIFRDVVARYCFEEIKTPIFEDTSLFERTIGKETDIVKKQMYNFEDKSGRPLTLRPEGTAPVVRAAISNNLLEKLPAKFFYIGEMFRYERPQKDRKRQFYQAGAEIFGEKSASADLEAIKICREIFDKLELKFSLEINTIGCQKCRPAYEKALKDFISGRLDGLCSDCRERYETNPLRVLDCKKESCRQILSSAPAIDDYLCPECRRNFSDIKSALSESRINFTRNEKLVRGLDYYNGCVFEFYVSGARDAVAAGGRYDGLVEFLGGRPVPACGFAIGIDRVMPLVSPVGKTDKYIVISAGTEKREAEKIAERIRAAGKPAFVAGKKLSAALKFASSRGFKYAVIAGEEELRENSVSVRNLSEGRQEKFSKEDFFNSL